MSLYEIFIGDGHEKDRLKIIGPAIYGVKFPNFRDCWVENDHGKLRIVIYTRSGGPRRKCRCYQRELTHPQPECLTTGNEAMKAHPLYIGDQDDALDRSYARWFFRLPQNRLAPQLVALAEPPRDMDQIWRDTLAKCEAGELRPAVRHLVDTMDGQLDRLTLGPDGDLIVERLLQ